MGLQYPQCKQRVGPACQTLEGNLILLKYQFKSKTFAKKKTWKTKAKVIEPPSEIKKGQFQHPSVRDQRSIFDRKKTRNH